MANVRGLGGQLPRKTVRAAALQCPFGDGGAELSADGREDGDEGGAIHLSGVAGGAGDGGGVDADCFLALVLFIGVGTTRPKNALSILSFSHGSGGLLLHCDALALRVAARGTDGLVGHHKRD